MPNHSLVPTRLPPQGERALASHLRGHRIEAVPVTPRGTVRGRWAAHDLALEKAEAEPGSTFNGGVA